MLSAGHTTVPANERIIDLRYPLFRQQVEGFLGSGILSTLHRNSALRIIRDGARAYGYTLHVSWAGQLPGDSDMPRCVVAPERLGDRLELSFRGFRAEVELAGRDIGEALRAELGGETRQHRCFWPGIRPRQCTCTVSRQARCRPLLLSGAGLMPLTDRLRLSQPSWPRTQPLSPPASLRAGPYEQVDTDVGDDVGICRRPGDARSPPKPGDVGARGGPAASTPPPAGARFLDVGANIGYFSLLAARSHTGVTIDAVEPFPSTVDVLRMNLWLNEIEATVWPVALGLQTKDPQHSGRSAQCRRRAGCDHRPKCAGRGRLRGAGSSRRPTLPRTAVRRRQTRRPRVGV